MQKLINILMVTGALMLTLSAANPAGVNHLTAPEPVTRTAEALQPHAIMLSASLEDETGY